MKYLSILIFLFFFACNDSVEQIPFNKDKWWASDDGFYEYRIQMTDDLVRNHLPIGTHLNAIDKLLGTPSTFDGEPNKICYELSVIYDYDWKNEPTVGKSLFLELSQDSTLISFEVNDWEQAK